MLQPTTHGLARIAAIALLLAAATACSSECDTFYDTYEDCGFGEAGDEALDDCNERIDADENCANAYTNLNACIDDLEETCTYPEGGACAGELEVAALACSTF